MVHVWVEVKHFQTVLRLKTKVELGEGARLGLGPRVSGFRV